MKKIYEQIFFRNAVVNFTSAVQANAYNSIKDTKKKNEQNNRFAKNIRKKNRTNVIFVVPEATI